jgi:hypothetical protein
MVSEHKCERCNAGCTGRHNEEERLEEIRVGPYLVFCGILIVLISMLIRSLF